MRPENLFSTPLLWQDYKAYALDYTPQFTARRLAVRGVILDTPRSDQRGKLTIHLSIFITLLRMLEHNLKIEIARSTLDKMTQYISYDDRDSYVYEDTGFFLMDETNKQCTRYMTDSLMMCHLRMLWSREKKEVNYAKITT